MSAKTICLFILMGFSSPEFLRGQYLQKHHCSVGIRQFSGGDLNLGYEFRANRKHGLELRGFRTVFEELPEGVFEGLAIREYALRRWELFHIDNGVKLGEGTWDYYGPNRAMPDLPSRIQLKAVGGSLGYRMSFQRDTGRWRVFLQPGLKALKFNYFEVGEDIAAFDNYASSDFYGQYPDRRRMDFYTIFYRQTRTMHERENWIFGLDYDVGLTCFLSRFVYLEGRLASSFNFGQDFHDGLAASLRALEVGWQVSLGLAFW